MRRRVSILAAAVMTAMLATACGSGEGIVINGTTAARQESGETDTSAEGEETLPEETSQAGGTKINIITGETQEETTAETSLESQTEPETTQAPTTAAPTTAAPATTAAPTTTAAPETTKAKEYAVRDVSKTMYAKSSVRVRESYSTSSEILGALAEGESVTITGESDNGWMRVNWKGLTGFVSKSYLSDTPATTTAAAENNRPSSTQSPGGTPGTTPGTATTPGGTDPGTSAAPGTSTAPGSATAPGGTSAPSPGSTQGPGGTDSTTAPSAGTSTGASGSISGVVDSVSPSGVTIRTSDGQTRTFEWNGNAPSLVTPGDSVQVYYQGNSVVQLVK